jgi:hypothetical protein
LNRVGIIESLERRTLFNAIVFSQPTAFPTGKNPSDLVAADLAGNGVTDIVTSDMSTSNIGVLIGNGDGTFQAPVFYTVGASPEALAVGDFAGNGIPDIVTANEGGNSVSVLMGNGDGTFAPAVTYPVGVRPEAVAVADLTGTGLLDIVTANEGDNTVSVLLNNGNGTFQPAVSYYAGLRPDGVALADLNGDERVDIVTVNPVYNNLHVLLNNGDGTFGRLGTYLTGLSGRAVAIADLNSDGRPDIVSTNLHSTTISLLEGNGDGTFQPEQEFPTGVFPFSVTIADVNGDGRPDVITANNFDNSVSVLLRTGTGSFTLNKEFRAGDGPVAAVAADVNGDGRPDIIAADYNSSTISVLLNQTVFIPLIPTTAALSPSQNPVEVGNRLTLSVQITPSSIGAKQPVGVVQFFDGDLVIGVGALNKDGVAKITTNQLGVGLHTISAHYGGDSIYAGSFTSDISEVVISPQQATPFVAPVVSAVHLPTAYVPGDHGIADVAITDFGTAPASGSVSVQLYASASSTFDSTAFALGSPGTGQFRFRLAGGQAKTVAIGFVIPANIQPGNYTVFAALAPASGTSPSLVSTVPIAGLTTQQAVLEFGTFERHRNFRLTRTLADGSVVSLSLSGAGSGGLTEDSSGGITIALSGTTGGSNLSISTRPGTSVTLDGLTDAQEVGNINAANCDLAGAIMLDLGLGHLYLGNASNSSLFVGGGSPSYLSFGALSGMSISCAPGVFSLSMASYTNQSTDSVVCDWLKELRCGGDFGASLATYGGLGGKDLGLTSAVIGGTISASWYIQQNTGSIQAGGVASGWNGGFHGSLNSFVDTGDFAGALAAHTINSIQIGNLSGGTILAGANFGSDNQLGSSTNVFGSGVLNSINVRGNVTDSLVAAGLSPVNNVLLGPSTTLLNHSAIRTINIGGTLDSTSRFLAVSLPGKARVNGSLLPTAGDVNFNLTTFVPITGG